MKKILLISGLDIWMNGKNVGNQAMYNTLIGYANRNWEITFLTVVKRKIEVINNLHPNVKIIRFPLAPTWCLILFRKIRDLLINTLNLIKKKLIKSTNEFENTIPNCNQTYLSAGPGSVKIALYEKLVWLIFQLHAIRIGYKLAKNIQFDLFYGYEVMGVPGAFILSKIFHKPFVSRFQGTFLYPFIDSGFKKWLFWEHLLALKLSSDLKIMTDDGTQGDKVLKKLLSIGTAKFWRNGVERHDQNELINIPNFKVSLGIDESVLVLMTLSKLIHWKRVDRAIRLIANITAQFPNICLLIIGDGKEKDKLEKLAVESNCSTQVRFIGSVEHSDIHKYFSICDIFLSLYDLSNVGNPLYEAMVAGKCIVTLNNGTTAEIVKDNYNGRLIDLTNCEENLAAIVSHLLASPLERDRLARNAKDFADHHFWSWEERMDEEIRNVSKLI